MPAYHSKLHQEDYRLLGNMAMLPIRSKVRGPALTDLNLSEDIIDESIDLFRANCLFKNYEIKNGSDRVIIYLTLFISDVLNKIAKFPQNQSSNDILKALNNLALVSFSIPGDPSFPLNALFAPPSDRQESELLRQYISQLRQETVLRLFERIYQGQTTPSKWWMMFSKRKFMGKNL